MAASIDCSRPSGTDNSNQLRFDTIVNKCNVHDGKLLFKDKKIIIRKYCDI